MKLQDFGPANTRQASELYGSQARRFERLQPEAGSSRAEVHAPPQHKRKSGFTFRLGKLGVSYEVQEPAVDREHLARLALERAQREREAAFRVEMEVESLRSAMAAPAQEEQQALELPPGDAPQHIKTTAQRAYAEQQRAQQTAALRPGVHIGVV